MTHPQVARAKARLDRLDAMPLSYLRSGYRKNSYEREARAAVERTRSAQC